MGVICYKDKDHHSRTNKRLKIKDHKNKNIDIPSKGEARGKISHCLVIYIASRKYLANASNNLDQGHTHLHNMIQLTYS